MGSQTQLLCKTAIASFLPRGGILACLSLGKLCRPILCFRQRNSSFLPSARWIRNLVVTLANASASPAYIEEDQLSDCTLYGSKMFNITCKCVIFVRVPMH
mmetsp:Transcript_28451/g.111537  ORF Transcript_28451/g.111537 Transcript_28451/m.111537 type:complete len:101 (-) Transcript_28451:623-925(-)